MSRKLACLKVPGTSLDISSGLIQPRLAFPVTLLALLPSMMDKFLIRRPLRKSGADGERQGEDADSPEEGQGTQDLPPRKEASATRTPWRQIRAEGLSCDYRVLFGRAEADRIFQELEKEVQYFEGKLAQLYLFGKWHKIPRKQVTYGDPGLTYTYSGVTFSPKPWIPVLESIRDHVQLATGQTFNFVLINRYRDGRDHMGEHRDDEKELAPRSPIASVSFGAPRDLVFRHGASRGRSPLRRLEPVKLHLEHGSLLLMNFPTNQFWYHSLPTRQRVLAPRVNLTFRHVIALPPSRREAKGDL